MSRAGRKRKPGKREPNGRPSRAGQSLTAEQEARSVVHDYRQRLFGISDSVDNDKKASTHLGRMCLQGVISEHQWRAGEQWGQLVNARYAAINAPRGLKTGTGDGRMLDPDAEADVFKSTKEKLDDANRAVEEHAPMVERKDRLTALRIAIIDQHYAPHLNGSLRTALNALVRHFGYEGRRAA